MTSRLAQEQQPSAARSVSSFRERGLQSAIEILLVRARSANIHPPQIERSANGTGGGFSPLELHALLNGSSHQSMLPGRRGQSDLMIPAEVGALHSSQLGSTRQANNGLEAAILACLFAQQSTRFAASQPAPTITGSTTMRHLLESLLQGQQTSFAPASAGLTSLPPFLSSMFARRTEMNHSNEASNAESQLLQLYLMERERQFRRENQR